MDKIEKLKKGLINESAEHLDAIDNYFLVKRYLKQLYDQIKKDGAVSDALSGQIEYAEKLLQTARDDIAGELDTYLFEFEGKTLELHAPQPVSCFSLPVGCRAGNDESDQFWLENYIYHQFGKRVVLNPNTKGNYINNGKFLFVKIDLTYDKQAIVDEVDDLVQHAHDLIGKHGVSKSVHLHELFDKMFSRIVIGKTKEMALKIVSFFLEESYGINIDPESLNRKYYRLWKKKNGVKDLRQWRKQQKGDT